MNDQTAEAVEKSRWDELLPMLEEVKRGPAPAARYFEALIEFGNELELCARPGAADIIFSRTQKRLQDQVARQRNRERKPALRFEAIANKFRETEFQELIDFFEHHKNLFPSGEKDFFHERITGLKEEVELPEKRKRRKGAYAVTRFLHRRTSSAVKQVRSQMYDSVYRYKKALTNKEDMSEALQALPDETGFYNSLYNLNSVLEYIGKVDPLWVEDFKAHYRELQQLEAMFAAL
jgi:hypothetical protein